MIKQITPGIFDKNSFHIINLVTSLIYLYFKLLFSFRAIPTPEAIECPPDGEAFKIWYGELQDENTW